MADYDNVYNPLLLLGIQKVKKSTYTSVGAGGDYATITAATGAGKTLIRLVSNITDNPDISSDVEIMQEGKTITGNLTVSGNDLKIAGLEVTGTVNVTGTGNKLTNIKGAGWTIDADDNILVTCEATTGTFTVNATRDNTELIGCISNTTDIVDNGTDSRIFMHTPKTSDNYPNVTDFHATVGTTGADYTTIQLALAAGKYNLKIITDITETVAWGTHTKDIVLIAEQTRIINLSVSNTSAISLYAKNVNFSVSGTVYIFHVSSKMYLDNCEITGNGSNNIFCQGSVYANNLKLSPGNGTLTTYIRQVSYLEINYSHTNSTTLGIRLYNCVISEIKTTGVAHTVEADNHRLFYLSNCIVGYLNCQHTNPGWIYPYTSTINRSTGNVRVLETGIGNYFNNCIFEHIKQATGEYYNCSMVKINYTNTATYNRCQFPPTGTMTIANEGGIMRNCKFNNIVVDNDNCTLINCYSTTGTITVNATADKTDLIGCKSVSAVVNNGTNTRIFMHDPKASDNYPDITDYATVGTTGADYTTIQLALAASKSNLRIITDITETVNWGAYTDHIEIQGVGTQKTINLSVANTGSHVIDVTNINFSLSGTNLIFQATTKFTLHTCKITGTSTEQNNFMTNYTGDGGIWADVLTIIMGNYGLIAAIRDCGQLNLVGGGTLLTSSSNIHLYGLIGILNMTGTFPTCNVTTAKCPISMFTPATINKMTNSTNGGILNRDPRLEIRNAENLRIVVRKDELSFNNCSIAYLGYYPGLLGADCIFDNCTFTGTIYHASVNRDDLHLARARDCTFTIGANIEVTQDNTTFTDCKITDATFSIEATADKTIIRGCRTLSAIVDAGTNSEITTDNVLI